LRNSGKHLGKSSEHGQNPFSKFINFILGTSRYSDSTANCSADVTCCEKKDLAPAAKIGQKNRRHSQIPEMQNAVEARGGGHLSGFSSAGR